jgi:methylmalonyl-CoA/ethylmalonyl-CoA epimerase
MIGRINHIAIAVPDVMIAARQWETILGAKVSAPQTLPEHGVSIVFVIAPNGKVELMEPFGEASPIASFLARNENGGIHHICYEVDDIVSATESLKAAGARVLNDGAPKIGAHGNPVLFLHPKDFNGTLIELEQVAETSELSQKD